MSDWTARNRKIADAVRDETARRDRRTKIWLLVVSLATLAVLAGSAVQENLLTGWRHFQLEYAAILKRKAVDDRGRSLSRDFKVEMKQVVLPELGTVDRCISCHDGFDDPRMTDVPNPHAVHPGRYLEWHETSRFGCTSCHRGQGRAMDFASAKAWGQHWDYPLLPKELTQSSCGVCHAASEIADRGGDVYAEGLRLFERKGCRSCHKVGGRGGALGPPLDNEGLKVSAQLPMAHVRGAHTLPQWLIEHFDDPQAVVAGSRMPQPGLSASETQALTVYVLSLQERDLPSSYLTPGKYLELYARARPAEADGMTLFATFCANCHDTGRIGRFDKFFATFIPAIRGETYRQTAEPAYVAANIRSGRAGTIMPPWGPGAGGLSEEEIRRLTSFVLDRDVSLADIAEKTVVPAPASPEAVLRGRQVFARNCAGCHGPEAAGRYGPSLVSATFQRHAADSFLFRTIAFGRRNTAMPAFLAPGAGGLDDPAIADVITFLRSLGPDAPPADRAALDSAPGKGPSHE